MKHIFEKHENCQVDGTCLVCDGGLSICTVCGLAEGSLTSECPGYKPNPGTAELVYCNQADFIDGYWWLEIGVEHNFGKPKWHRRVEILYNSEWEEFPYMHLKNGHIFRMFEPDGTRVIEGDEDTWIATGDAYFHPEFDDWGVPCVKFDDTKIGEE